MQNEAFTYIWHNLTLSKKYIGYHKGTQDDGYIASSSSEEFWKDFNDPSMRWNREIIFEGTSTECLKFEQDLLSKIDFHSGEYYNMARGSEVIFTAEVREKIRQHHLGKPSGMLGKKHSEETKRKVSLAHKGRKLTEEWKQKLRKPKQNTENMKGPLSPEHIAAMKAAQARIPKVECPYCHEFHRPSISKRWHFENCKHNPDRPIEKHAMPLKMCPHCGKIGLALNMGQWHFENCKLNPNNPHEKH
jgi:NUMOD3 motif